MNDFIPNIPGPITPQPMPIQPAPVPPPVAMPAPVTPASPPPAAPLPPPITPKAPEPPKFQGEFRTSTVKRAQAVFGREAAKREKDKDRPTLGSPTEGAWGKP